MSTKVIDGRAVAATLKQDLAAAIAALDRQPRLVALGFAGDDAGAGYARRLLALAEELGVDARLDEVPGDATTEQAVAAVHKLNDDAGVDGVLILLPPPAQIDTAELVEALDPAKDVDGATPHSAAALYLGTEGPAPATAVAVVELLKRYDVPLSGKDAVIVGRSNVIGKPLALLLLRENATVTVCHSRTADLAAHTRQADVLVAAVGQPEMIGADMVSEGTTVIDVGTNYVDGGLVGDVRYDEVAERAGLITPVPGGVGPLTNLMLVRNLVDLIRRRSAAPART
jgi:methylenetetrahydrofolate dehydrogenase (NADP+)/methenyltetrahydrofolate cyclohydrolase